MCGVQTALVIHRECYSVCTYVTSFYKDMVGRCNAEKISSGLIQLTGTAS
jgi:predicted transcriptional regulator